MRLTCYVIHVTLQSMARGPSGRLVIEIDPALKGELHAALATDGKTLKDWFVACASVYLKERLQPMLPAFYLADAVQREPSKQEQPRKGE